MRITLVICALGACSPFGGGAFECALDSECSGGRCTDGFCSFPDSRCASGFRYGELSGPRSGQCVGEQGPEDDAGMTTQDAPDGSMQPMPDAGACYGTGLVRACFTTPPSTPQTLNSAINTMTSPLCDSDPRNADWCVIAGTTVELGGAVTVTGDRPLVLVATTTLTVQGILDVSSKRGGRVGPAANGSPCNAGTAPTGANSGGAGGSFGGKGGNGGRNGAGTSGDVVTPTALRGGCPGQAGMGGNGGARGNGGGAVYLIADGSISISGAINASGAGGGAGGGGQGGGGGAGSGGMIGLDAPTVTATGMIFANGGGGGEGGTSGGNSGDNGDDPLTALTAASGGTGSTSGGDGGNGSVGATLNGANGGNAMASGGGGGGGAGVIKLHRATAISGGSVSPAPT